MTTLALVTVVLVAMLAGMVVNFILIRPELRRGATARTLLERYEALDALSGDQTGAYPVSTRFLCPLCAHTRVLGAIEHCSPGRVTLSCRRPPTNEHHSHLTCGNCGLEYIVIVK